MVAWKSWRADRSKAGSRQTTSSVYQRDPPSIQIVAAHRSGEGSLPRVVRATNGLAGFDGNPEGGRACKVCRRSDEPFGRGAAQTVPVQRAPEAVAQPEARVFGRRRVSKGVPEVPGPVYRGRESGERFRVWSGPALRKGGFRFGCGSDQLRTRERRWPRRSRAKRRKSRVAGKLERRTKKRRTLSRPASFVNRPGTGSAPGKEAPRAQPIYEPFSVFRISQVVVAQ